MFVVWDDEVWPIKDVADSPESSSFTATVYLFTPGILTVYRECVHRDLIPREYLGQKIGGIERSLSMSGKIVDLLQVSLLGTHRFKGDKRVTSPETPNTQSPL